MKKIKNIFILLFFIININNVYCDINMTEYYTMPKIYSLDDYDKCLEEFPDRKSTYCYVDVVLKPNRSIDLWNYIENLSSDKRHYYRHDRLKRGICINWCENIIANYDADLVEEYYEPLFDRNRTETLFAPDKFRNSEQYRKKYEKIVNQCINIKIKDEFELAAYSEIEYCMTNEDRWEIDSVDIAFLVVCAILVLLTTFSSFLDFIFKKAKSSDKRPEHYKIAQQGTLNQALVSFSFFRNWYKLTGKPPADEVKSINTMKFGLSCGVILIHCVVMFNMFTANNPQYLELHFHRIISMLIINGLTVVQTYFTISGFLLAFQFCKYRDREGKFDGFYFWRQIINRLFRLLPVYAFVILLNATFLIYAGDGPVWRHFNEIERKFCRENWWTNVLFVNNYIKPEEGCLIQSWYLGADFQLFVIALAGLMAIWKYPKLLKWILSFSIIFSLLVPAIVTYIGKWSGIIMVYPESHKYVLWNEAQYIQVYIPMHTNTGAYLAGVIAGWIYYNLRKENKNLKENIWFKTAFVVVLPTALIFILFGFIFYAWDVPLIWSAVYAIFAKNLWGVIAAIIIIALTTRVGWIVRHALNFSLFRPLGQISYSVYLIHTFFLRVTMGHLRQPAVLSHVHIAVKVSAVAILSYLVGFVLCVCIEMPFANIQKLIIKEKKRPIVKKPENGGPNDLENTVPRY